MASKTKLTNEKIDGFQPGEKAELHWDHKDGLFVQVSPKGLRTFYWKRWVPALKRDKRIKIGRYPETSLKEARDTAGLFNEAVRKRKHPEEYAFGKLADGKTLNGVWEEYRSAKEEIDGKVTKYLRDQEYAFNRHLKPSLGDKPIQIITTAEVADHLAEVSKKKTVEDRQRGGKTAANRVRSLLSRLYTYAIEHGYSAFNPVSATKKHKEGKRDRTILPEEMPRFLEAVESYGDELISDFLLILLCSGQRKQNVLSMRWDEIDFDALVWTIPGDKTKSGTEYRVPIVKPCVEILRKRRNAVESEWVFPSRKTKGHLTDPRKHWAKILQRAKIPGLRFHDLRHTCGTYLSETGAPFDVTVRVLNHADSNLGVTGRYIRPSMESMRRSLEAAVESMMKSRKP